MNLTINNQLSFTSGLNYQLINECKNTSVKRTEEYLKKNYIDANFHNCKPVAFCVSKVINIFDILKKKTGKNLYSLSTSSIQTYVKQNLAFNFNGYGFCLPETQTVLKGHLPFRTGSIFYETEKSIEILDDKTERAFQENTRSSSHYLSSIIHEMMHAYYIDYIYNKYGYEGDCFYTSQKYLKEHSDAKGLFIMHTLKHRVLSDKENNVVEKTLGLYATKPINQYHEVFAETFTQLICNSLSDNNSLPLKNPLDELQNYSKDFLKILSKILSV